MYDTVVWSHVSVHFPHHSLLRRLSFPIVYSWILCQKLIDHGFCILFDGSVCLIYSVCYCDRFKEIICKFLELLLSAALSSGTLLVASRNPKLGCFPPTPLLVVLCGKWPQAESESDFDLTSFFSLKCQSRAAVQCVQTLLYVFFQ